VAKWLINTFLKRKTLNTKNFYNIFQILTKTICQLELKVNTKTLSFYTFLGTLND